MELRAAGLKEPPFGFRDGPVTFVRYGGQQKAFDFFDQTWQHNAGLGLFQGPPSSGKSAIITAYLEQHSDESAIAVVDAEGCNKAGLLEAMLRRFGYPHKFDSFNELLNMVTVFIKHQTASGAPPLLFVENTHAMNPAALRVLCELAAVRVREKYALRIILASDRSIDYIAAAPAMECVAQRLTGNFHLEALTIDETSDYLYAKMRQGGCIDPDFVFPDDVCDELYRASAGWPGILDRLAASAIENAAECPVRIDHIEHPPAPVSTRPAPISDEAPGEPARGRGKPLLVLTRNGELLRKIRFSGTRLLIGRTEHNDLAIDSRFVSRHHALMVRHGSSTLLMDLNSANGTFVNSRRISNQVLANQDVVTLGEYSLKFEDAGARRRVAVEGISLDETVVMKTMDDLRKTQAKESTAMLRAGNGLANTAEKSA